MPCELFASSVTTVILCCLMDEASHESNGNTIISQSSENGVAILRGSRGNWWNMVVMNVALLLVGQSGAVLLGKLYFDHGGKSTWMATLVQTAGFPVLFLPLFFFPFPDDRNRSREANPSLLAVFFIYLSLGTLMALDNMLYSLGLLYLPISTYSIITATQLGFNVVFAVFLNSERLTFLILNSVVLITLSALLAAFGDDSSNGNESEAFFTLKNNMIGFISTVIASAAYSLLLSLMQLSLQKVIKKETFSVVLEMQIYTSLVATSVCLLGLMISGELNLLRTEMEGFVTGKMGYIATLFGAALAWQLSSVGVVGLIFLVSALFSNLVSMLSLPFAPLAAVLFYGEKMEGNRIVAVCLVMWGFFSYAYQHYLDGDKVLPWQQVANTDSN